MIAAIPKCGPVVTLMASITSMHASVDFITMFYFVTPYRRVLLKLFRSLRRAKYWNSSAASVTQVHPRQGSSIVI